jgi:hypothetical protein
MSIEREPLDFGSSDPLTRRRRLVSAHVSWPLRRSVAVLGLTALIAVALAWPMLFTNSGLGGDWEHHLWYIWRQSLAISANHLPSMFLNTAYSVFYPQYVFYGGTIYALAGTLALVPGESPTGAYILTYILGFAAAYGGWYWVARMFGLGRYLAQVPALLFVTSACYLTLAYGQGDWPEFLAVSMLPLMIAAGLNILRAERLRLLPAVGLSVSSIVFFGSHLLTVLWASTLFALTIVVVVLCVPQARQQICRRGLISIFVLLITALLVNSWFLVPIVAYASHTRIGSQYNIAYDILHSTMHLVSFSHLFTLSRATAVKAIPDYALSLPTLTIAWVLASIAILLCNVRRGTWVRVIVIFAGITAGTVVLMTHVGLLLALPKPYTLLQFSYRLEGYVLMGVTATVVAILVQVRSSPGRLRLWAWTILPVLIASVLGAIQQLNAYPRTPLGRGVTLTSRAEIFAQVYKDYAYVPLPFISARGLPRLEISPAQIRDDDYSLTIHARPRQLVATNIGGGPDVLHITGASIAGTDERAQLVLAIGAPASVASADPSTPLATEHISISPAHTLPIILGRLLTLIGVVVLIAVLVTLSVRAHRERRRFGERRGFAPTVSGAPEA